jgi:DMSO/TMAO reductase YedYZ molybdopterin-dependent catalytic subunit
MTSHVPSPGIDSVPGLGLARPVSEPGIDAPENRPAPLAALVAGVTPISVHYRRNHFPYPDIDVSTWHLSVVGAVERPLALTLDEIVALPARDTTALLECAGHRRTEFLPPIPGVQWGLGALSQARWGGVSLASVLELAGVRADAVEVVFHGADIGPFAEVPGVHTFSRSIPVAKAMHPDTLLATTMNGEPLPREHGAPIRSLVPGWYAMDSVKWITQIELVTEPFRGPFQELDYRFQPVGETGIGSRIDEMPAHSLFLSIVDGQQMPAGSQEISGIAWAGAAVADVDVRVDGGDWQPAKLRRFGAYERVLWSVILDLAPGRHTVAVRATDGNGRTQPDAPIWNRRGYVNTSIQRFTVHVT